MKLSKKKILLILAERQLSIKSFAELAGILPNNFSQMLSRGACTTVTAGRIAGVLNVNVQDILEDE